MEHLDYPDLETWEERRRWFEALEHERGRGGAASALSEQGCALMIDLQAVFCAGAWATTVILAAVIVDSQARYSRSDPRLDAELAWLRRTRNLLVHENPKAPAITVEDQWTDRRTWERNAKRAVAAAMAALYPGRGESGDDEGGADERSAYEA